VRQIRRIIGFDAKGMVSLALWLVRRQHGVPPGATTLPYIKEQRPLLLIFLMVQVVETVVAEILLRGLGVPDGVRVTVLFLDVYSIFIVLAIYAACATRPHVVSAHELRIRNGAFFDARIPRDLISSVRLARAYNETGKFDVKGGRLALAIASQTNVIVELTEPVVVTRPLGLLAEITGVRIFCDDPAAAVAALQPGWVGATSTGRAGE
jgi:hypothetical protein